MYVEIFYFALLLFFLLLVISVPDPNPPDPTDEAQKEGEEIDILEEIEERNVSIDFDDQNAVNSEIDRINNSIQKLEEKKKSLETKLKPLSSDSQAAIQAAPVETEEEKLQKQEQKQQEQHQKRVEWNKQIDNVSNKVSDISYGKLRVINKIELDRLINVRGRNRPIAIFVPTRSSSLSFGGVYIYDTTKVKNDNALYLFAGQECTQNLIDLGERLLMLMSQQNPEAKIVRILKTTEGDDFHHMIHQIGGHIDQIQSSKNHGDEFFFENQFFKTLLHVVAFEGGEMNALSIRNPTMEDLPKSGAAIIDTSDRALYLWFSHVKALTPEEEADRNKAVEWVSAQEEYSSRDLTMFTEDCVPPNIAVIFKSNK